MENNVAPYLHWHTRCAACSKVTLARACNVPGEIQPIEHNPVIRCPHCGETRQYLDSACFLTPLSTAASPEKSAGALAVVAGLIAAVKLARVESREIQIRSPPVRLAISDSIDIARIIVEAAKGKT
jgi:DNA-directed RNA polymerase subunit RPC12/RpoP